MKKFDFLHIAQKSAIFLAIFDESRQKARSGLRGCIYIGVGQKRDTGDFWGIVGHFGGFGVVASSARGQISNTTAHSF